METLQKRKLRTTLKQSPVNKTTIVKEHTITNLIEELNSNLVELKEPTLIEDWTNFTNDLGAEILAKISL
ncbi:hypothetical protein ULMA_14990 [Patiriisocius marinus]|uniref:Uncharacterized protein n=1 Tax=Patiriisocius marinus TaxID=1397112 RepID=A0A5J4J0Q9_9FLAO|nr:hypothetical protein [Patiriisocius marinus]GER59391.1 hypothetical protein ULMA_14990 [Patiriisocius marinus]